MRPPFRTRQRRITEQLTVREIPGFFSQRLRRGGLDPVGILGALSVAAHWRGDLTFALSHRPVALLPALALQRRGTPFVIDWCDLTGPGGVAATRSGVLDQTVGAFDAMSEPFAVRAADGVTVINEFLADRALSLGVPADRMFLLPPATPARRQPVSTPEQARAALDLPAATPIVLFSGFGRYDADLLEATANALLSARPDVNLVLLGDTLGDDRLLFGRPELSGRVRVGQAHGARYWLWLAAADVFLLPYRDRTVNRGRFPHKFVEYLAAGRPIVANPTGPVATIMSRVNVGILAPEDGLAMAQAAGELLDDPERSWTLGRNGRALAEACFDEVDLAHKVSPFFDQIARRRVG